MASKIRTTSEEFSQLERLNEDTTKLEYKTDADILFELSLPNVGLLSRDKGHFLRVDQVLQCILHSNN